MHSSALCHTHTRKVPGLKCLLISSCMWSIAAAWTTKSVPLTGSGSCSVGMSAGGASVAQPAGGGLLAANMRHCFTLPSPRCMAMSRHANEYSTLLCCHSHRDRLCLTRLSHSAV